MPIILFPLHTIAGHISAFSNLTQMFNILPSNFSIFSGDLLHNCSSLFFWSKKPYIYLNLLIKDRYCGLQPAITEAIWSNAGLSVFIKLSCATTSNTEGFTDSTKAEVRNAPGVDILIRNIWKYWRGSDRKFCKKNNNVYLKTTFILNIIHLNLTLFVFRQGNYDYNHNYFIQDLDIDYNILLCLTTHNS